MVDRKIVCRMGLHFTTPSNLYLVFSVACDHTCCRRKSSCTLPPIQFVGRSCSSLVVGHPSCLYRNEELQGTISSEVTQRNAHIPSNLARIGRNSEPGIVLAAMRRSRTLAMNDHQPRSSDRGPFTTIPSMSQHHIPVVWQETFTRPALACCCLRGCLRLETAN